jgi:peptide/nickel transport system permease protein
MLTLPVVATVSTLVFLLLHLIPGDPTDFMIGENASLDQKDTFRRAHHLHLPILFNPWPLESVDRVRTLVEAGRLQTDAGARARDTLRDRSGVQAPQLRLLALEDPDPTVRAAAEAVLSGGDPLSLPTSGVEARHQLEPLARLRSALLETQYAYFFRDLLSGRLESLHTRQSVVSLLAHRFPMTLRLGLTALAIALLIALPVGTLAAWRQYSSLDNLSMLAALGGVSMPNFWLGPLLILVFSIDLNWFPVSGAQAPGSLVLPALTLGLGMAGLLTRMTRASVLEVVHEDYVRTARAKGLTERRVMLRHALRNALVPVVTVLGLQFGSVLSGSIITEEIFGWPGIGRELVNAIRTRDFPLVQGCVLLISVSYVVVNLLTDLVYAWVNPRVRLE